MCYPMEGPGLGTELLPAVFERTDLTVRRTPVGGLIMATRLVQPHGAHRARHRLVARPRPRHGGRTRGRGRRGRAQWLGCRRGSRQAAAALARGRLSRCTRRRFDVTDEAAVDRRLRRTRRRRRRNRHPGQQCRDPVPQADGRSRHGRLAPGDRHQPHQRLPGRPRGGEAHDPARPRQDHQHRLADQRGSRARRSRPTRSPRAASRC